jgi:hypothetical protein
MGKEVSGAIRTGKERHEGKILLETNELGFRGPNYRLKLTFSEMREVTAANGELRVDTKNGVLTFEVGPAAEKWREKILHPKTRIQKLGVKPATPVRVLGDFEADFIKELKASNAKVGGAVSSAQPQDTFLAIDGKKSLATIAEYAKKMRGAEALWLVYPKGNKEVTESDVLSAGRKSGLSDVKVVAFSATHTALKFVIPAAKR